MKQDYVLGVDVGGTKVLVGYVQRDGTVLSSKRYPMDRSCTPKVLESIYFAVDDFLRINKNNPLPLAVGFGLVGRCDTKNGIWVRANNIPIPEPVNLAEEIFSRHGLKSYLNNDVFCATLAEMHYGAGKIYDDFILINVGTGISMGIVAGSNLVTGAGNVAGEVGQWCLNFKTGTVETLEQLSSGGGMITRAKNEMAVYNSSLAHLPEQDLHSTTIFEAADNGDALAIKIVSDAVDALCMTVSSLITMFNPGAVVLAGSVACTPGLINKFMTHAKAHAYPSSMLDLQEICLSKLDVKTVGLIGASYVAWQGLK